MQNNISSLIGLCQGIIADGEVNQSEALFLLEYLQSFPVNLLNKYPANILSERLSQIFQDGIVDDDESGELLALLVEIVLGKEPTNTSNKTIDLAWEYDECPIIYSDKLFVVTGTFERLSRGEIESHILSKGGRISKKSVPKNTDYVLIGKIASSGWAAGNYGRKIESALSLRDQRSDVKFISEDYWCENL